MRKSLLILLGMLPASLAWSEPFVGSYNFPITDRYVATVIGTPTEFAAQLPDNVPIKQYSLPNLGEMPELFWYNDALRFSAALQDHPAPLVFNIAGTGAGHDSDKLVAMQKALYQAGFHVINIGSPTELNFQLSASTNHTPGYVPDDVADIYRVMQQAYAYVKDKKDIEVTGIHVAGYSLGAMHAAFVAELDQREKKIGIQKVYMINPPVNLYNSVKILDDLFTRNVPHENGMPMAGKFLDGVIQRLAKAYREDRGAKFNNDFLYAAYVKGEEKKDGVFAVDNTPEGLIGFSFRLTSSAIVFTSDVMTHAGYIVPKEMVFKSNDPLGYYAQASFLVTFQEYVDDMAVPAAMSRHPGLTREQALQNSTLNSIEGFLKSNPNVRVVSNQDEIILAPGELQYLENLMGNRMTVYPLGGHCGNMSFVSNVDGMVSFFKGSSAK